VKIFAGNFIIRHHPHLLVDDFNPESYASHMDEEEK
jgi:hypothetical protein